MEDFSTSWTISPKNSKFCRVEWLIRSRASLNLWACTYALVVLFFLSILRLAATRQSVAEFEADLQTWQSLQNAKLAVNLEACLFKALPFACLILSTSQPWTMQHHFPEASG